jgi:tetratricopeptide (TPR) repeat protein
MKKQATFFVLIIATILGGCNNHPASPTLLNKVESLMQAQPDSAYALLASIDTDTLNAGSFARWCMLKAELSHRTSHVSIPSIEDMERTLNWYKKQGTEEESLKAEFYLAVAYTHAGESKQAMKIYARIYAVAEKKKDYQLMGYTCSYMADLYFDYEYASKSLEKKTEAAFWLKKANNPRSYVCALRDICMNYAAMDSLSLALTYLQKADSICQTLNDINVHRSILNAYGNIYQMKGEYKSAENYFYQALNKDANPVPDYFALASLYIETNQLQKAKAILQKIPINEGINRYVVYWDLYEIAKRKGNFEQAIHYLEQYTDINDSLTAASSESKVLEIENRYKHQKLMTENAELRLKQTGYLLACAVCLIVVLIVLGIYFGYRKRTEKKLLLQQADLRDTRNRLLELSIEMERKNALLKHSEEEEKELERMREEMETLTARYRTLRKNMLESSPVYKKLHQLAKQRKPQNTRTLIGEELWEQIKQQAQKVYPGLRRYVINRCPDLSESEWAYCCLYMFGFDTNDEATLLGINPPSVRTKTLRLRTRLNIDLPAQMSLYEYITMQI